MSSNYIKVTVCPGLNLRPSISFVDRMRVEADGRQLTEDVERKLTMVLAKKVFAPQIEYIEWEMNRLAEMPYDIGTFYEVEEFFRRIIADYDASHKQTVEMELETLIRKEERRFPEMQDSGSAKIIPVEVKFRETRSRIGIFEYLKEAIECCIDHIQDAPAVSQQELRSYMLPWFSPFAAPWCGKIQRAFPKAYVTMNFELILVPRTNTYINLNHCSTPDEFKAEVIEGVSRFAFKAFTKPLCKEHLDGINKLLDTKFTPEDMEYIYTNLGNGINHELCMKFVKSGYDLKVIEESV